MNDVTNSKKNGFMHLYSIKCEKCQKVIEIPIKKSDKESITGGIFRIIALHQCTDAQYALLLYFDDHMALRQKIVAPVTVAGIHDFDLSIDEKDSFKQIGGFDYLHRKFKSLLAQIIFSMVTGQQVIFLGEKLEVSSAIDALKIFSSQRTHRIDYWAKAKSDACIIGTKKTKTDVYPGALIVDFHEKTLTNSFNNNYFQELVEELVEIKNLQDFIKIINDSIHNIYSCASELASIRDYDELSLYLESLTVEGKSEDYIELIVAIAAQLNHLIAQYYRFDFVINNDLITTEKITPYRMWIIDSKNENRIQFIELKNDLPFNWREQMLQERIIKLLAEKPDTETLYEYFTPLNHYIFALKNNLKIIFAFPRYNEDNLIITNALKFNQFLDDNFQDKIFDFSQIPSLISEHWYDDLKDNSLQKIFQKTLEMREILPLVFEHSILESHYFLIEIKEQHLRSLMNEIIANLTVQYTKLSPKILHKNKIYTIRDTLKGLIYNNEIINLIFAIHFYPQKIENKEYINIILDLFIDPDQNKLGLDILPIIMGYYQSLLKIILISSENYKTRS
ncbi:MAG: hypothetical protein FK734_01235 [Asgard group archaeon]|nr:hypothetical protein [Asgard group archaeon]